MITNQQSAIFNKEQFDKIYKELCERAPDVTLRGMGICDDIYWGRDTPLYRRAVHYGLMKEYETMLHKQKVI